MVLNLLRKGAASLVSLVLIMLAGTVLAGGVHGVYKGFNIVKLYVDGREIKSDVPAFILDGRSMIPARLLAEALGATVSFDQATYTVNVQSKDSQPLREGFYVTDKDVGIMVVAPTLKKEAHGHIAGMGNKFLQVMVVVKNFSQTEHWISPETFSIMVGDVKYDHVSVTFSNTARLIPRTVKPGEYATGIIIYEVPENASYFLVPGQMLYGFQQLKVPVVPKN